MEAIMTIARFTTIGAVGALTTMVAAVTPALASPPLQLSSSMTMVEKSVIRRMTASGVPVGDPMLLVARLLQRRHEARFATWADSGTKRARATRSTGRIKSAAETARARSRQTDRT